ncbi:MAG: ribose-phosphate pyrophosphokinase [Xanthomonadales bacterium]|nr:ribose-phosphate pyrophosphokinase [Xanthomonadales bacterium]
MMRALFALDPAHGAALADELGLKPAAFDEQIFEDGERKLTARDAVMDVDCLVVESLYAEAGRSADAKLLRLGFFIAGLKAAGASRVTLVAPYLCYTRKDRRQAPADPVLTRHVAELLEAMGTDRLVTLDVHNPAALDNAFRIPVRNCGTDPLFAERLRAELQDQSVVVVSPDIGGIKRSDAFRSELARRLGTEPGRAIMEKLRGADGIRGELLLGDPVDGRVVVLIDDLINTGGTLSKAAAACRAAGASQIIACASHGLFVAPAAEVLSAHIDRLLVSDSVPAFRLAGSALLERVEVVKSAACLATAL